MSIYLFCIYKTDGSSSSICFASVFVNDALDNFEFDIAPTTIVIESTHVSVVRAFMLWHAEQLHPLQVSGIGG